MNIPNFYLAVGSCENWRSALSKGNVWGLSENRYLTWNQLNRGDVIFLYPESPISAVVGYGTVADKFFDDKPFFAEDWQTVSEWPWRFIFDVQPSTCELLRPNGRIIELSSFEMKITLRRGFQRLPFTYADKLLRKCRG